MLLLLLLLLLLLQGTMVGEEVRSQVCVYVRSRLRFVYLLDCVIASLGRLASLRVWFDLAVACLVELQPAWQSTILALASSKYMRFLVTAATHAGTIHVCWQATNCRPRRVMLTLRMMHARAEGG